jgi:hypothetical protein
MTTETVERETLPDRAAARNTLTTLSSAGGGIVFQTVSEARDVAYLMAGSSLAVRAHLRDNPGACFGIVIQAVEWGMSPFAVANKSYAVNDQLAYESQLIQAVILRRAPIKGRIRFAFEGEGPERVCIASATDLYDDVVEYRSPKLRDIKPQNSPLWKNDPDQQLAYYSGRSLCRRHFPDVLMGIYDVDELEGSPGMKTVGPKASGFADRLAGKSNGNGFSAEGVTAAIAGEDKPAEIDHANIDWNDSAQVASAVKAGHLPKGYELEDGVLIVPEAMKGSKLRGSTLLLSMFDEVRSAKGTVIKTKAETEAEADPEIVRTGAQAFVDGAPRAVPDELELTAEQAVWWLDGYDKAKAAAESGGQ